MATHSSILAWEIPWTEELGGLLSMDSERVGHNRALTIQTTLKSTGKSFRRTNKLLQGLK